MAFPDFYAVLGVAPKAGPEDIKKAYRDKARASHPDHNHGKEAEFRAIHEAYKVLSDPNRRRDYDISRSMQAQGGKVRMEEFSAMELEASGKEIGKLLREILRQGNMTRVKVKFQGEEILDLPLNTVAVLGGGALLVAPILSVLGGIGLSQVVQVTLKNQMMEDFEDATRHHEAGDLIKARKLYTKVLDRSDFFLPAFLQMGHLYRQLGENEKAQQMFSRVVEIMPFGEVADLAREQLQQIRGY